MTTTLSPERRDDLYGSGLSDETTAAARQYLRRGWRVIPIPPGQKGAAIKDWPNLRLSEGDIPRYFASNEGIGMLLGEPSGGLVDVDLDVPEAVAVAPLLLPETDMIHGRPGKPQSHRWYLTSPIPATERFRDLDGATLVELRSTGGQTVVPPSVHQSGEPIAWAAEGEPTRISGAALRAAVARVAAGTILARHWPAKGSRHEAALALSGLLLRGGMPLQEAERFVEVVAQASGDEEWRDRVRAVRDTAATLLSNQPATGAPSLAALVGEQIIMKLREWLDLELPPKETSSPPTPRLRVLTPEELLSNPEEVRRPFVVEGHIPQGGSCISPGGRSRARVGTFCF